MLLAGFNTYYSNTSDYTDSTNYLYTGRYYWTLSPVRMTDAGFAHVGRVHSDGYLGIDVVSNNYGVRPVVSLMSTTLVSGEGTSTNPYIVQ